MNYETVSLRELVGGVLIRAQKEHGGIYVIDSDLAKSTTTDQFEAVFPEHFIESGIAEQNAMSIAAGVASEGKIPFYVNFAIFISGTCWTQLRQICYANLNVKLIATHPGMDGGYDGATHHANEDIALMRALPNLKLLVPSSPGELYEAVQLAIHCQGPVYIRCARDSVPRLSSGEKVRVGKAVIVEDRGDDFALIFEGSAADLAFKSFDACFAKGKRGKLINLFSIKPVDRGLIREIAGRVGKIITVENHSVIGGLGGLVAESVADMERHAPVLRVGVRDVFTESGPSGLVKEKYGLSVEHVLEVLEKDG